MRVSVAEGDVVQTKYGLLSSRAFERACGALLFYLLHTKSQTVEEITFDFSPYKTLTLSHPKSCFFGSGIEVQDDINWSSAREIVGTVTFKTPAGFFSREVRVHHTTYCDDYPVLGAGRNLIDEVGNEFGVETFESGFYKDIEFIPDATPTRINLLLPTFGYAFHAVDERTWELFGADNSLAADQGFRAFASVTQVREAGKTPRKVVLYSKEVMPIEVSHEDVKQGLGYRVTTRNIYLRDGEKIWAFIPGQSVYLVEGVQLRYELVWRILCNAYYKLLTQDGGDVYIDVTRVGRSWRLADAEEVLYLSDVIDNEQVLNYLPGMSYTQTCLRMLVKGKYAAISQVSSKACFALSIAYLVTAKLSGDWLDFFVNLKNLITAGFLKVIDIGLENGVIAGNDTWMAETTPFTFIASVHGTPVTVTAKRPSYGSDKFPQLKGLYIGGLDQDLTQDGIEHYVVVKAESGALINVYNPLATGITVGSNLTSALGSGKSAVIGLDMDAASDIRSGSLMGVNVQETVLEEVEDDLSEED